MVLKGKDAHLSSVGDDTDRVLSKHFFEATLLLTSEHVAKQGFGTNDVHIAGYDFTAQIRRAELL